MPYNPTALEQDILPRMMDDFISALDDTSRTLFEPLYEPSLHQLQRLMADDPPDVLMCDVFAQAAVDLADHLGLPFVVTVPSGLGDFGLGDALDTPSSLTGYSQL